MNSNHQEFSVPNQAAQEDNVRYEANFTNKMGNSYPKLAAKEVNSIKTENILV